MQFRGIITAKRGEYDPPTLKLRKDHASKHMKIIVTLKQITSLRRLAEMRKESEVA